MFLVRADVLQDQIAVLKFETTLGFFDSSTREAMYAIR